MTVASMPRPHEHVSPAPRKLTSEQRAVYDDQGYVIVPGVFDPDELAAIDAEVDRIKAEQAGDKVNDNFIFALGLRSPMTQAICGDERVLTLIEDMVYPGIAIYSAKMVEKTPYDQRVCHWHQDNAYYNKNSSSACRMSTWLPLQDTDVNNGGLWVVPGSHKGQTLEAHARPDGMCTLSFADGKTEVAGAEPVSIKAGDLLLFHANLWHRSLGNQTDERRRSFIVSYQEATAVAGNGNQHKILRSA